MMAEPEKWLEKMSVQSQFLQDSWCQVVESTYESSLTSSSPVFVQQTAAVPKNGAGLEKSSWRTAILIGLSLVSLLMTTACSGSLNERSGNGGAPAEIQISTDTTSTSGDPSAVDSLPFSPETTGQESQAPTGRVAGENLLNGGTLDVEAFSERQRVVSGWLKFVRQEKIAGFMAQNLAREKSGEKLPIVDLAKVNSDVQSLIVLWTVNVAEFKRWRQLIAAPKSADATGSSPTEQKSPEALTHEAKALDSAALMLTIAASPDELQAIDQLLVETVGVAGY